MMFIINNIMKKNLKYKIYKNFTGSLIPFSLDKDVPFKVKRLFIINGKMNSVRADHAHLKCSQYLLSINGKIEVQYENKKGKYKKILSDKNRDGLLLKPKSWCKIKFKNKNSTLIVFCDREYEFFDYIEHYRDFLKLVGNTK